VNPAPPILVVQVGEHFCGIAAAGVEELVFLPALTRVAGQPAVLEGFMNLRGSAVPVVTLDRLFGLPTRPMALHTPLIVIGKPGHATALAVDRVLEVTPPGTDLRPLGKASSFNDCAAGEFDFEGRTATLLDLDRILLEQERQRAVELRARVQAGIDSLGISPA
jgi:purine-binding chemotaxis protein CheW